MLPLDLTGLECLKGMIAGDIPHPNISKTVPMRAVKASEGSVIFRVSADERHLNPVGGVNGGFYATVLDAATGCAVQSLLPAGKGLSTVDLNVKMIRPIPINVDLIAEGKAINLSRSLGISEGYIKDESGKIYAHATTTCMVFDLDKSSQ